MEGGGPVKQTFLCPLQQASSPSIVPAYWRKCYAFSFILVTKNLLKAYQRPDTMKQGDTMASKMQNLSLSYGAYGLVEETHIHQTMIMSAFKWQLHIRAC